MQVFLKAHMPIAFFMHSFQKKFQMTTAVCKPSAGFSSVIQAASSIAAGVELLSQFSFSRRLLDGEDTCRRCSTQCLLYGVRSISENRQLKFSVLEGGECSHTALEQEVLLINQAGSHHVAGKVLVNSVEA